MRISLVSPAIPMSFKSFPYHELVNVSNREMSGTFTHDFYIGEKVMSKVRNEAEAYKEAYEVFMSYWEGYSKAQQTGITIELNEVFAHYGMDDMVEDVPHTWQVREKTMTERVYVGGLNRETVECTGMDAYTGLIDFVNSCYLNQRSRDEYENTTEFLTYIYDATNLLGDVSIKVLRQGEVVYGVYLTIDNFCEGGNNNAK